MYSERWPCVYQDLFLWCIIVDFQWLVIMHFLLNSHQSPFKWWLWYWLKMVYKSVLIICVYDFCSVTVTEDGKNALLTLAQGDMRKALNILQSTSMAYKEVTEDNVYTCVGHPLKNDISNIVKWLLNEDFSSAYKSILYCISSLVILFWC